MQPADIQKISWDITHFGENKKLIDGKNVEIRFSDNVFMISYAMKFPIKIPNDILTRGHGFQKIFLNVKYYS